MHTKFSKNAPTIRKTGTCLVALWLAFGLAAPTHAEATQPAPPRTWRVRARARAYKALHMWRQNGLPTDLKTVQQAIDAIVRGDPDGRKRFAEAAEDLRPSGPNSKPSAAHLHGYVGVLTHAVIKRYAKAPANKALLAIADDLSHAALALENVDDPSTLRRDEHSIHLPAMVDPHSARALFYDLARALVVVHKTESPFSDTAKQVARVAQRALQLSTFDAQETQNLLGAAQRQAVDSMVNEQAARIIVAARTLKRPSSKVQHKSAQTGLIDQIVALDRRLQQPIGLSEAALLRLGSSIAAACEVPGKHHHGKVGATLKRLWRDVEPLYVPLRPTYGALCMVTAARDIHLSISGTDHAAAELVRGILAARRVLRGHPLTLPRQTPGEIYAAVEQVHDLASAQLSEKVLAGLDRLQSLALLCARHGQPTP